MKLGIRNSELGIRNCEVASSAITCVWDREKVEDKRRRLEWWGFGILAAAEGWDGKRHFLYRIETECFFKPWPKFQKKIVYLQFDLKFNAEYKYRHV